MVASKRLNIVRKRLKKKKRKKDKDFSNCDLVSTSPCMLSVNSIDTIDSLIGPQSLARPGVHVHACCVRACTICAGLPGLSNERLLSASSIISFDRVSSVLCDVFAHFHC